MSIGGESCFFLFFLSHILGYHRIDVHLWCHKWTNRPNINAKRDDIWYVSHTTYQNKSRPPNNTPQNKTRPSTNLGTLTFPEQSCCLFLLEWTKRPIENEKKYDGKCMGVVEWHTHKRHRWMAHPQYVVVFSVLVVLENKLSTYIFIYIFIYIYMYKYIYIRGCTYVYIYIYMCVYMYM